MKKIISLSILIVFIFLIFSNTAYAGDIKVEIKQEDRNPAVITITDSQNIKNVWVYQEMSENKYTLIKVRSFDNIKEVKLSIPIIRLSTAEKRNFKVIIEDESGKYSKTLSVDKILTKEELNKKILATAKPKTSPTKTPTKTTTPTKTPTKTPAKTTTPTKKPTKTPVKTTPKVTETQLRQKLVEVALKEVGTTNGRKYLAYCLQPDSPNNWCSEFASWCGGECGYYTAGIYPLFYYAQQGVDWFRSKGRLRDRSYVPSPGDICFTGGSAPNHTAIVCRVDKSKNIFYTIDGGSDVKENRRNLYDGSIYGYGVPNYAALANQLNKGK